MLPEARRGPQAIGRTPNESDANWMLWPAGSTRRCQQRMRPAAVRQLRSVRARLPQRDAWAQACAGDCGRNGGSRSRTEHSRMASFAPRRGSGNGRMPRSRSGEASGDDRDRHRACLKWCRCSAPAGPTAGLPADDLPDGRHQRTGVTQCPGIVEDLEGPKASARPRVDHLDLTAHRLVPQRSPAQRPLPAAAAGPSSRNTRGRTGAGGRKGSQDAGSRLPLGHQRHA